MTRTYVRTYVNEIETWQQNIIVCCLYPLPNVSPSRLSSAIKGTLSNQLVDQGSTNTKGSD